MLLKYSSCKFRPKFIQLLTSAVDTFLELGQVTAFDELFFIKQLAACFDLYLYPYNVSKDPEHMTNV